MEMPQTFINWFSCTTQFSKYLIFNDNHKFSYILIPILWNLNFQPLTYYNIFQLKKCRFIYKLNKVMLNFVFP